MSKPQYRTLVKALDDLRHQVDWLVLNSCSSKEIKDSYLPLHKASVNAEKLVARARQAMAEKERDAMSNKANGDSLNTQREAKDS